MLTILDSRLRGNDTRRMNEATESIMTEYKGQVTSATVGINFGLTRALVLVMMECEFSGFVGKCV